MSEYKSTGNTYVNDYKKEGSKMPDFTGTLEITREQIQELIAIGKAGGKVELGIAQWEYPSKRDPNQSRFWLVATAGKDEKYQKQDDQPKKSGGWDDPDVPF